LVGFTHVATSEVTSLKHELRDHTVELAARVAEALLAGAEGSEVLGGLWNGVVEELEVDAAGTSYSLFSRCSRLVESWHDAHACLQYLSM